MLSQSETAADGHRVIEQTFAALRDDDDLSAGIYRANLMTHMAGQLFVRDIEIQNAKRSLSADLEPSATFLNLAFDDAIAHFLARGIMTPEEFYLLSDTERFRSFTMALSMSDTVTAQAKAMLDAAMQPGGIGLREFQRQVRDSERSLGIDPSGHGYLENVYRTSTATSYNAGRFRQQTDPDIVESGRYLWRYVTANDGRVRDEHARLHGKEWRINDPQALKVYPPNGYQCRCSVTVMDARDSDPEQFRRDVDADSAVQTGFSGAPGDTIEREARA